MELKGIINYRILALTAMLAAAFAVTTITASVAHGAPNSPGFTKGDRVRVAPGGKSRPDSTNTLAILKRKPTSILLRWHDNSDTEKGNLLVRTTASHSQVSEPEVVKELGILDGWIDPYKDTGLNPLARYCFQIRPYNDHGTNYSNVICEPPALTEIVNLRILTQNVFGQDESDCGDRLAEFGEKVAWADPAYDIVAVQEYFDTTWGISSCDKDYLLDEIRSTGRYNNSDNTHLFQPEGETLEFEADGGVGLFSLYPIEKRGQWEWDKAPFQARVQGFSFARVSIPNTPLSVDVYVVHPHSKGEGCDLDCNKSNMAQVANKISQISAGTNNPVIIMGDFNIAASPDGNPEYQAIMDALHNPRDLWKEAHPNADPGEGYTKDNCPIVSGSASFECNPTSGKRIDYIFVANYGGLSNSSYEIVVENPDDVQVVKLNYITVEYPHFHSVSDHYGVEANIVIRDNWIVEDKGFGSGLLLTGEQVAVADDDNNDQELILDSSLLDSVLDDNSQQTTLTDFTSPLDTTIVIDSFSTTINQSFRLC